MTESTSPDQIVTGSPAPAPASRWEDFIDIFYAPSEVYARRQDSGFGLPMLIVCVVTGIIVLSMFNAMAPIFDAEFARGTAAAIKQGAKPEQLETGRKIGETFAKISGFVGPAILIFLTGLVLWVAGKFVGARQSLNAAILVAAYANVPRVVNSLLSGVQALLMDPASLNSRYAITLSLARFMDPATSSPVLRALAGRVDLFTIWTTVLLAIGLAVTGKIPRSKAAVAAFVVWLFGAVPDLLGALRQ